MEAYSDLLHYYVISKPYNIIIDNYQNNSKFYGDALQNFSATLGKPVETTGRGAKAVHPVKPTPLSIGKKCGGSGTWPIGNSSNCEQRKCCYKMIDDWICNLAKFCQACAKANEEYRKCVLDAGDSISKKEGCKKIRNQAGCSFNDAEKECGLKFDLMLQEHDKLKKECDNSYPDRQCQPPIPNYQPAGRRYPPCTDQGDAPGGERREYLLPDGTVNVSGKPYTGGDIDISQSTGATPNGLIAYWQNDTKVYAEGKYDLYSDYPINVPYSVEWNTDWIAPRITTNPIADVNNKIFDLRNNYPYPTQLISTPYAR